MAKFRKKPVVVEAWKYDRTIGTSPVPVWIDAAFENGTMHLHLAANVLLIETLEGTMKAKEGDWIIKGVKGELYPCKSDIFEATYEAVT